jgi:hypothetical protein
MVGRMPTERAWTVAQRLHQSGASEGQIRAELLRSGFTAEEAAVALSALAQAVAAPGDRWRDEASVRAQQDRGYFLFLLASVLISGGALLAVLSPGRLEGLGLGTALAGGLALARGAWAWWRGRGV